MEESSIVCTVIGSWHGWEWIRAKLHLSDRKGKGHIINTQSVLDRVLKVYINSQTTLTTTFCFFTYFSTLTNYYHNKITTTPSILNYL